MRSPSSYCVAAAIACVLGVAACASSADPSESESGSNQPNPEDEPIVLLGSYTATSSFRLTPSQMTTRAELFVELEDLADDPVGAITDALLEKAGLPGFLAGPIKLVVNLVAGERLEILSDAIVAILEISVNFDLVSSFELSEQGGKKTLTHRPIGVITEINGQSYHIDLESKDDSVQGITGVSVEDEAKLTIDAHDMELPYAQFLATAVDQVIAPALDPEATDFGDALQNLIDCAELGGALSDVPLLGGDSGGLAIVCSIAVDAVANKLLDQIANLGLVLPITIDGQANAFDDDGDRRIDRIEGSWNSTIFHQLDNKAPVPFEAIRD